MLGNIFKYMFYTKEELYKEGLDILIGVNFKRVTTKEAMDYFNYLLKFRRGAVEDLVKFLKEANLTTVQ